ncbi:hypothetical protein POM88_006912 [Heracleum sosnowskyi]|uniref:CCHC-type domain-containing protein n=1 Tax=Heracleum sosnowskyi TaxID=360622 RepID=A0AAD8J545_9APIA|nr:hypothetical protein POM88_006912 [Heracleum sosnowskyi]
MQLHLMSMDEGYVDCIDHGPHVPMKPNTSIAQAPAGTPGSIPKLSSEWTPEDIIAIHKDKKTMNILFNGLESDMFDNVINCSTAKEAEDLKEESAKATPSPSDCEGRIESRKGNGKMIEDSEPSNQDEMDELDEHLAFLSSRFSKHNFKRNPEVTKPFRKDFQSNTNYVERSKLKCFNCGMGGHFASECKRPKTEKKDMKFEPVDYKDQYFELLKQKERAFITQDYDWADDGNDSEEDTEFVIHALMADSNEQEASSSTNQVITTNLTELSKEECNSAIDDINAVLETQFIEFEKMRMECQIAKDERLAVLKREEILKVQLVKEHEFIVRWNDSRNVATNIIKVQGVDTFYKESMKKEK